ncbi:sugar kinase [Paenisporosarcina antarctica]|uniref:Sugar kinase n=1 Tax=Paenisporosarcina antarctica TaxID=417367 RepID=A0A4P7A1W8_9BACL|nr:sugar kinase [Paenisporosarcina antarctica]QBP42618.1 sugar kinase [Paenisporosarcina antarctica]
MDIITIGDGMITFDPSTKGPLRFVNTFERKIGGAELNVMLGCARLGLDAGWISRLGKDEFGRHIINTVRGEGVDISEVHLMPGYATSLNFKEVQETGDGRTFYYRLPSPTETLSPESLPFEYMSRAKIIHLTGVFCAILEQNRAITLRALVWAKEKGIVVSFDPNIRLRLWSAEEARETLLTYLPYVDHLLTSRDELELLFDSKNEDELLKKLSSYQFKSVVMKDADKGSYALVDGAWKHVPGYPVTKVVDTVGAGDGFDSGYLYGLLQGWSIEERLTFANAIGAMVVQVNGDNEGLPYLEEVEQFLGKREIIVR